MSAFATTKILSEALASGVCLSSEGGAPWSE
jgi:hypothetical protein